MAKDNTSATSASSATNATADTGADRPAKMNTEADSAAAAIAARNAATTDAAGVAQDGTATEVARRAANGEGDDARAAQDRQNAERAAAASLTPRILAEAASSLAASQVQRDLTEAPSIAEQAKNGDLPDPVELALKARGISGSGRRLDETIPGGLTVHPDGYYKNAHGEEVDAEGHVVEGGAQPRIDLSGGVIGRL